MNLLFEFYNTLGDVKENFKAQFSEDIKNEIFQPKQDLLEDGKTINKRSSKILMNIIDSAFLSVNHKTLPNIENAFGVITQVLKAEKLLDLPDICEFIVKKGISSRNA